MTKRTQTRGARNARATTPTGENLGRRGSAGFSPAHPQVFIPPLSQCDSNIQYWAGRIIEACREGSFDRKADTFDRIVTGLAPEIQGVPLQTWGMAKAVARRELGVPLGR